MTSATTAPDSPDPERSDGPARAVTPGLHLIATPIGAARDITLRALDLLAGADVLAAEDTRSLRRLMELHGISVGRRPLLAYHDHNGPRMRPRLLSELAAGRTVVYASEAGTPLVADPGYQLVREAVAAGHAVHAAPGPSAVLTALVVSGLPSDRFAFMGFAPTRKGERERALRAAAAIPATLIFYESPRRVHELLANMVQVFGTARDAALCRELTKRHEEVLRMPLGELVDHLKGRDLRGEVVLVVDRARTEGSDPAAIDAALVTALARTSLKDAVAEVAATTGAPRRIVYQAALRLQGET